MARLSSVPRTWARAPIGQLCELVNGRAFKPVDWSTQGLPIVRIQNLNNPTAPFNYYDRDVEEKFLIQRGDLLFAWSGTPGTSFGAHIWQGGQAVLNQHIFKVIFDEALLNRDFFRLAINQTLDELISKSHGGAGLRHITKGKFEETEIALAPLEEQHRIVSKLASLSNHTGSAHRELSNIRPLIGRYKRAILSAAFRGELSGSRQSDLAFSSDQRSKDNLPLGWKTRTLGEIASVQSGLTVGKKRGAGVRLIEVPYLRVANVQRGHFNLDEVKTLRATKDEIDKLLLMPGDILMNEGGDRDKLGRGWVWSNQVDPCIHQNHVFRVRLHDNDFPPKFVSYFANEFGQDYFFSSGTQTTNLASISKAKLSALPLPIPSAAEANEIVSYIEKAFGWIDVIEQRVLRAVSQLRQLDEAVLKKAFQGRLVPQSRGEASAERLLVQIRDSQSQLAEARRASRPALRTPDEAHFIRKRSMAKRRTDVDKDHLRQTLASLGGRASPRDLWQRSEMEIDEFYKLLREEVTQRHIYEEARKESLSLPHAT